MRKAYFSERKISKRQLEKMAAWQLRNLLRNVFADMPDDLEQLSKKDLIKRIIKFEGE